MQLMTVEAVKEMEKNGHFTEKEVYSDYDGWGDIYQVSAYLILAGVVPYRHLLDAPVVIHNAFATSGHSANSLHYEGLASDHHSTVSLYEQCKVASKVGFNGIGAYFDWSNQGLHTDMRGLIGMPNVYWMRGKNLKPEGGNVKGDYIYFSDVGQWLYAVGLNSEG